MKSLLLALILSLSACNAPQGALPNDCAIVATEAEARLLYTAAWSRVALLRFFWTGTWERAGHVVIVWQVTEGGEVMAYDADGTLALETRSQDINDIKAALNKIDPSRLIYEARFLE